MHFGSLPHRLLGLGTGQDSEEMGSELLLSCYAVDCAEVHGYPVAIRIDIFERKGRSLLEGIHLCGLVAA